MVGSQDTFLSHVFQTGAYSLFFWGREVIPEEAIAAEPVLGHVDFTAVCIPGGAQSHGWETSAPAQSCSVTHGHPTRSVCILVFLIHFH